MFDYSGKINVILLPRIYIYMRGIYIFETVIFGKGNLRYFEVDSTNSQTYKILTDN